MDPDNEKRIQESVLSKMEKRALVFMAKRTPSLISSDHLTLIGFFGALIAGAGYALSGINKNFVWLASLGFVINWFGDSLDGTVARVRNRQRPIYGFFIDHNVDAITALVICVGAGLSPFISFYVGLLILAAYYIISIFTYINAYLTRTFKISYGGMGPTELRLAIIIINCIMYFTSWENNIISILGAKFNIYDFLGLGVALILLILFTYFMFVQKKEFEEADPPPSE